MTRGPAPRALPRVVALLSGVSMLTAAQIRRATGLSARVVYTTLADLHRQGRAVSHPPIRRRTQRPARAWSLNREARP